MRYLVAPLSDFMEYEVGAATPEKAEAFVRSMMRDDESIPNDLANRIELRVYEQTGTLRLADNRDTLLQIGRLIAREHVTVKTALKERIRQLGPLATNCVKDYQKILDKLTELMEEIQY